MIIAFSAVTAVVLFAMALLVAANFHGHRIHSERGMVLLAALCAPILLSIALWLLHTGRSPVLLLTRMQLLLRLLILFIFAILYNLPVALLFCRRALAAVPTTLHEAALLEGASSLQRFTRIVLPLGGLSIAVGLLAAWAQSLAGWAILMMSGANIGPVFDSSSSPVREHHVAVAIATSVAFGVVALVLQYYAGRAERVTAE